MAKPVGHAFLQATQHKEQGPSDQQQGKPAPPLHLPCTGKPYDLPAPSEGTTRSVDLRTLIETRASVRAYAQTPLTLPELSHLLWCSQGVKETHGRNASIRTVPSAGARHALETVVLANRVAGLPSGLYRFHAFEHKLFRQEASADIAREITEACYGQTFVLESAATFLWIAVPYRMTWRYGERGYRYLHLDAGHVCQNLYLAAEAIDCGVCAVAAYDDDALNDLLRVDGKDAFAIYLASVGRKRG
jgi:SagB-type dehydrogenase family enzyme